MNDIVQFPNFVQLLDGKTVGGPSAGACLFSTYYWYEEEDKILKGLGVLPISVFVHAGSEEFNASDNKLECLKKESRDLKVIVIKECDWIEEEL